MILKLTEKDKLLLPPQKYLNSFGELDDVEPLNIPDFDPNVFVERFLIRRGVLNPKVMHAMVAEFNSVEMHVDNLSPFSYATIAIMLNGAGSLIHTVQAESYKKGALSCKKEHISNNEAITFDFHLPHQFIAEKNCIAILADVKRKNLDLLNSK
jgi:hypothetical protein